MLLKRISEIIEYVIISLLLSIVFQSIAIISRTNPLPRNIFITLIVIGPAFFIIYLFIFILSRITNKKITHALSFIYLILGLTYLIGFNYFAECLIYKSQLSFVKAHVICCGLSLISCFVLKTISFYKTNKDVIVNDNILFLFAIIILSFFVGSIYGGIEVISNIINTKPLVFPVIYASLPALLSVYGTSLIGLIIFGFRNKNKTTLNILILLAVFWIILKIILYSFLIFALSEITNPLENYRRLFIFSDCLFIIFYVKMLINNNKKTKALEY